MRRLAKLAIVTMSKAKVTKRPKHNAHVEIGIVKYPECLKSAIFGFTELFTVANRFADSHEETHRPFIRVTHWQASPVKPGKMDLIFDSHPGISRSVPRIISSCSRSSLLLSVCLRSSLRVLLRLSHMLIPNKTQPVRKIPPNQRVRRSEIEISLFNMDCSARSIRRLESYAMDLALQRRQSCHAVHE